MKNGSSLFSWIFALLIIVVIITFVNNQGLLPKIISEVSNLISIFSGGLQLTSQNNNLTSTTTGQTTNISVANSQLVNYALQLINQDRQQNGLSPVSLSYNGAAQAQAEDILSTGQLSHWMTNGDKPYMSYTLYGGLGFVQQNAADNGYTNVSQCSQLFVSCPPIDPMSSIRSDEYDMMYNDATSDWGHRDNILDPYHTNVSIGIAYNQYFFVMIQNFENDYIQFNKPITTDNRHVELSGTLPSGYVNEILIYYDLTPTPQVYQQYKNATSYSFGTLVGGVAPPGYRFTNITTISPQVWDGSSPSIDITFDMSQIENVPGVYTLVTWVKDGTSSYTVTSYSVFFQ